MDLLRSDPQLTDLPYGLLGSLAALDIDIVPNLDRARSNVVLLVVGVAGRPVPLGLGYILLVRCTVTYPHPTISG